MQQIKVEFFYENQPYRLSSGIFQDDDILLIYNELQNKYKDFTEKINKQNGYLEVNLSHSKIPGYAIHHEAFIMGLDNELIVEINAWEHHPKA